MNKTFGILQINFLFSMLDSFILSSPSIFKSQEVATALASNDEPKDLNEEIARVFYFEIEEPAPTKTAGPPVLTVSPWKYVITGPGDLGSKARENSPYGFYALRENSRIEAGCPGREHRSWRYFPVCEEILCFTNQRLEISNRQELSKYIHDDEILKDYSVFISQSGLTQFLPRLLNIFFFYHTLIRKGNSAIYKEKIIIQWWRDFTKDLPGELDKVDGEAHEKNKSKNLSPKMNSIEVPAKDIEESVKNHLYKSMKRVRKIYFPKLGPEKLTKMVKNVVDIEQEENMSLIKNFKNAMIKHQSKGTEAASISRSESEAEKYFTESEEINLKLGELTLLLGIEPQPFTSRVELGGLISAEDCERLDIGLRRMVFLSQISPSNFAKIKLNVINEVGSLSDKLLSRVFEFMNLKGLSISDPELARTTSKITHLRNELLQELNMHYLKGGEEPKNTTQILPVGLAAQLDGCNTLFETLQTKTTTKQRRWLNYQGD